MVNFQIGKEVNYRYGEGIVEDKNLIIQIYHWELGNSIYNVKTGRKELTPGINSIYETNISDAYI